ncbi:MAG: transglycosylase SLT domain-containing protein, partial [Bacteroidota bacterium]
MRDWKIFCTAILLFSTCSGFASEPRTHTEVVRIYQYGDTTGQCFVQDLRLYAERWDTLAQTRFWRKVMHLPPDSAVINIASSRQVIDAVLLKDWEAQTEKRKEAYRDSIREYYCLDSKARIFVTSGKNHFYNFRKVLPTVNRGVQVFQDNNVDPWYAQAILLIESPAKLQKSPVGAYGSFQLMRGVAVRMGLKVNRYVDERKNLVKSARAAAKFLNTVCIPETRKLL